MAGLPGDGSAVSAQPRGRAGEWGGEEGEEGGWAPWRCIMQGSANACLQRYCFLWRPKCLLRNTRPFCPLLLPQEAARTMPPHSSCPPYLVQDLLEDANCVLVPGHRYGLLVSAGCEGGREGGTVCKGRRSGRL